MLSRRRIIFAFILFCAIAAGVVGIWQFERIDAIAGAVKARVSTPATVQERVEQYGAGVRARMEPYFKKAGIAYPAARLALIGLKEEKQLELWAGNAAGAMRLIKIFPIKAASGTAGPKLREGDRQVPEGIYAIESLNPNSSYHLSLRVNYPNAFDRARAKEEGRTQLGGDIMIHGKAVSIGCLAMGDEAAEDLFVLSALTGVENITVLLCPYDFRIKNPDTQPASPAWLAGVYRDLKKRLADYPTVEK